MQDAGTVFAIGHDRWAKASWSAILFRSCLKRWIPDQPGTAGRRHAWWERVHLPIPTC